MEHGGAPWTQTTVLIMNFSVLPARSLMSQQKTTPCAKHERFMDYWKLIYFKDFVQYRLFMALPIQFGKVTFIVGDFTYI